MHLAIGTPMHGGLCTSAYRRSVEALRSALVETGNRCSVIGLGNESLINRARNTIVWHFLQSDATHLLMVDADIGFRVQDIARMAAAQKPIIVAPVPLKTIDWGRVARAARAGVPDRDLVKFSGLFNIVHLDHAVHTRASDPIEIQWGGTGCMLIERQVFEELKSHVDVYRNRCPGDAMPLEAKVHDFFPTYVRDEDLLSEDYGFCEAWRGIGGKVWAAPWCEIVHMGTYAFSGSYKDIFAEVSDSPLRERGESRDRVDEAA